MQRFFIAAFSIQQKLARRISHLADFSPVQMPSFSPGQLARRRFFGKNSKR
jgi:hypothetical protein